MIAWDVAVIGSGVAGSTASLWLAQGGLRVLLLDKGTFPRQKVCGEFLSPEGAALLQRLGVWSQVASHQPPHIHTFTLSARKHAVHCPLALPGWGLRRWTLDWLLWEHAQSLGITTWSRSAVRQVTGNFAQGYTLTVQQPDGPGRQVLARAVLCAAGRYWRQPTVPKVTDGLQRRQWLGMKTHVRNVPLDGRVELHTLRQGYCGLAEVDEGMTVVCCWVKAEALRRAGGSPDRLLAKSLQENPYLQTRLRLAQYADLPWTTVAYASRSTPTPVEGDLWKVGDSVAMIAPLTGDGMGMAMQAAERAARLLLATFREDLTWAEASLEYERGWRQDFSSRVRWGRGLETIFRHPWLASLACMGLRAMPSLINAIYCRTRDLNVSVAEDEPDRLSRGSLGPASRAADGNPHHPISPGRRLRL